MDIFIPGAVYQLANANTQTAKNKEDRAMKKTTWHSATIALGHPAKMAPNVSAILQASSAPVKVTLVGQHAQSLSVQLYILQSAVMTAIPMLMNVKWAMLVRLWQPVKVNVPVLRLVLKFTLLSAAMMEIPGLMNVK